MKRRYDHLAVARMLEFGLSINIATEILGMHRNTLFSAAKRDPRLRAALDEGFELGDRSLRKDGFFFVDGRTMEHVLTSDFDKIPRKPPFNLRPWVEAQLRRNPLAILAA